MSELNQSLNYRVRGTQYKKRLNGFRGKLLFVGLSLATMLFFDAPPILNQISMPGWYSRALQYWFIQGLIPIGTFLFIFALGIDLISGKRIWCRYCCPQSLLLMIVGRFSPKRVRIVFDAKRCTCSDNNSPCRNACPLMLNPKGSRDLLEWECNNCGDCAQECKKHGGAISQKIAHKP